jgi:hypothetical protein
MRRIAAIGTVLVLVAACGGGATPAEPFDLVVAPGEYFPIVPGQLFVVLVSAEGGTAPVTLTASVDGAASVTPGQAELAPGEVLEVTLAAEPAAVGSAIELTLAADREGERRLVSLPVEVVEWEDTIAPLATELRHRFVAHLESVFPDMGITASTEWTPTITKPQILVVMHYLFFSEEWEMGVTWHVTVPEHAWSRMYLRPRDQLAPTFGLEIPTYLDPQSLPRPRDPPAEVDR